MKESTEVLLDELLKDYQTPEQILGENGILKQLTKRLAERALQAEMTHHLGYAKHDYQSNDLCCQQRRKTLGRLCQAA